MVILQVILVKRDVFDNMASWVEELFPPKFKVNDLFDNDQAKPTYPRLNKHFRKIYEDVYEEMLLTTKDTVDTETVEHGRQVDQAAAKGEEKSTITFASAKITATKPSQVSNSKVVCNETRSEDWEDKCVWTAEEMKILRNSLKCSKLNNIRLSVLTQALQKDCERIRNTCQDQANEILKLNRKYNDVKKQNRAMKIACKAFREDAKNSQENFEDCQCRLEDAIKEKKSAELELVKMKHELEALQKQNKMLQVEFERQQMLQEKLLENQNISLRSFYEKEITDLVEMLDKTKLCLEKEKNEHTITKKALAHLRLHFADEGS